MNKLQIIIGKLLMKYQLLSGFIHPNKNKLALYFITPDINWLRVLDRKWLNYRTK